MNFEFNLIYLIKRFFLHDQKAKSRDKNLNIFRRKRYFIMKEKAFFINFKRLSMKQITQVFPEGESLTLRPVTLIERNFNTGALL